MPMMEDKRLFVCWRLVLGPPLLSVLLLCVVSSRGDPDVSDPCASAATQRHQGDIAYLPSSEQLAKGKSEDDTGPDERRRRGATSQAHLLWPNGIIYYSFSSQFTGEEEMKVVDAMRHWEEHTCVRFQQRSAQYTYINFFQGSGCCSYVGFLNFGPQGISLAKRCLKFPTIVHEIGHALGFWHEHTRPDRDNYVDVLYDNIEEKYVDNFEKLDPDLVDSHGVGYDYNSVMHYDRYFFTTSNSLDSLRAKGDVTIPLGQAVELSPLDIQQTNLLYAEECDQNTSRLSTLPQRPLATPPPLPFPACGALLAGINGSFTSPQYPSPYPPAVDCGWHIRPSGNFLITLELWNVSVEQSFLCNSDYIKVYEGSDESGILRSRVCGTYDGYLSVIVGTGQMFVRFHSDAGTSQNIGFSAIYRVSDLNECARGGDCSQFCRNTFGGYECVCREGFYLSADGHTCFDINECGVSNGGCESICINTGGSYHCGCEGSQVLQPDQVSCRPKGASCSILNGDCSHICTETTDSRVCSCYHGYRLEPDGRTCFDVDECSVDVDGCAQYCINNVGSYRCACRSGYHLDLDNRTCLPDRVCSMDNGKCDHTCRSAGDNSALCSCNRGYRLGPDETTCEEIDECIERRNLCAHICVNTNGSYRCDCREGYELDTDNRNCRNVDECRQLTNACQFNEYCRDTYGSYTCGCPRGYYVGDDRRSCDDIDECELGYNYVCEHGCTNLPGSYECICREGFALESSWLCRDIDECRTGASACNVRSGARCHNTIGSYYCTCDDGFQIDSSNRICTDIDECSEGLNNCNSNTYCINEPGSYFCDYAPPPTTVTEPSTTTTPPPPVTEPPMTTNPSPPVTEPPMTTNPPPPITELPMTTNPPPPKPTESHSGTEAYGESLSHTETNSELFTTFKEHTMSSTTNATPSTTNATPSTTNATPSTTDATPSTTDATPSTTDATPSTTDATPSTTDATPSTTDATPSTTDATPSTTDATPSTTDATPSTTDATPSTTDATPSTTDATPSTTDATPSTTDATPSTTNATPSTSTMTSLIQTTSSVDEVTVGGVTTTMGGVTTTVGGVTTSVGGVTTTIAPTSGYTCSSSTPEDAGSFHSENWPQTYPYNVDCEWNITLLNPKLILEIWFEDNPFSLAGKMPKCKRDWVKVYSVDVNGSVVTTWGPFCEFETPPLITTKTSMARIKFHSGSRHGNSRKGFKVNYKALEVCVPPPPPLIVQGSFKCNIVIRAGEKFGPPEFPGFITTATSQSCRWVYRGPPVQIRFLYFDLPKSENCTDDSLRLYRGLSLAGGQLVRAPICGPLVGEEERVIRMNTTYFTIQLKLSAYDGSIRGFHGIMEPT